MGRARNSTQATAQGFAVFGTRRGVRDKNRDSDERAELLKGFRRGCPVDVQYLERLHRAGLTVLMPEYEFLTGQLAEELAGSDESFFKAATRLGELAGNGRLVAVGGPLLDAFRDCVCYSDELSSQAGSDLLDLIAKGAAVREDSERLTLLAHNLADRLPGDYQRLIADIANSSTEDEAAHAADKLADLDAMVCDMILRPSMSGNLKKGERVSRFRPLIEATAKLMRSGLLPEDADRYARKLSEDRTVAKIVPALAKAVAADVAPRTSYETLLSKAGFGGV